MKLLPALLLVFPMNAVASLSSSSSLSVTGDRCSGSLHVEATDTPLSAVLVAMSREAGFSVRFDPAAERQVSIDREDSVAGILRELMGGESVVAIEDRVAECGDRYLVHQVWILPHGTDVDYVEFEPVGMNEQKLVPFTAETIPEDKPPQPRGLRKQARSEAEFEQLREQAKRGELVGHPDTGEPITLEEYERIMEQRGDEEQ